MPNVVSFHTPSWKCKVVEAIHEFTSSSCKAVADETLACRRLDLRSIISINQNSGAQSILISSTGRASVQTRNWEEVTISPPYRAIPERGSQWVRFQQSRVRSADEIQKLSRFVSISTIRHATVLILSKNPFVWMLTISVVKNKSNCQM